MKLTLYTNYVLRTMQYAALKSPDLVRIDDVATAHGISRSNLVKAVHEFGRLGYLETVRGRAGGVRLARPADTITIGEVVRITEAPNELVECFNGQTNTCPLRAVCKLSRTFHRAQAAFFEVLDEVTIADIAANRGELLERLQFDTEEGQFSPSQKRMP